MIRCHVFHSWSVIFRNWEYIFFLSTILKNSWSHLYSDSTTGQKSWWNVGPHVQVGIYKNRLVWEGSNQRYKISNATKSAVFAATDSGPGNATQNLCEAICAHQCTSKTNKQTRKKQGSFRRNQEKRGRGWPEYTPAGSLLLCCWPQKCAKRWNRLTGFLLSLNTSAFCR